MEEVVPLDADRLSLHPKGIIGSANVVRILVNDEAFVPNGGLHAQAQVVGSVSGPFHVQDCDRQLTIQSSTENVTVTVPSGTRVDPKTVVKLLQNALSDVAVEVVRGHLILTDTSSIGIRSSIRVTGSAAASLGFTTQRGARGRQVYPGWSLVTASGLAGTRHPQFSYPIRQNPIFKLTYVAQPHACPRCSATLIENDYRFDMRGEAVLVQDEDLLYQAALKILLTRLRSNPYHPGYGSAIMSRIGSKAVGAVASLLTSDVQTALANMQALQREQTRFQAVSAKERLFTVSSVRVIPSTSDPTVFEVDVVVGNAAGTPVSLSIVFSVPGAVALAGTNGLSLGLESVGI